MGFYRFSEKMLLWLGNGGVSDHGFRATATLFSQMLLFPRFQQHFSEKLGSILRLVETNIMNQNDTGKNWAAFDAYWKQRL